MYQFRQTTIDQPEKSEPAGKGKGKGKDNRQKGKETGDKEPAKEKQEEPEEKLTPDIYTYRKEEIKRIEKRKDNKHKGKTNDLFEGMDADTMKEIEQLIKD